MASRNRGRARKAFPDEMTSAGRWVRWANRERKGKTTKVPLTVSGRAASSKNEATWTDYTSASASTVGDGLGFVLGNGVGCVDLDDCLDDGAPNEVARRFLDVHGKEALLVEVSYSGRGLHMFLPMEQGKGSVRVDRGQRVEVYPPDSGRYVAVTGEKFVKE